MCPRCGRDAPLVYKAVVPYCTACGAVRAPVGPSVNLAGKPAQVGGTVASVFGWLVLGLGGSIAIGVGLLVYAIAQAVAMAIAWALPLAVVTLVVGTLLLRGGQRLSASGDAAQRETREQALLAFAAQRGRVRAEDVAQAFGVGVAEADAMLTDLAKREPDKVALDVDDDGVVWYRAASGSPVRIGDAAAAHVRVSGGAGAGDGIDESEAEIDREVEDVVKR